MLYLQLVKLQAAMKEVRNDLKIFEENLDEDFIFGPICQCIKLSYFDLLIIYLTG